MNRANSSIDLERIRRTLTKNIPWSPLDFIPGISLAGDKTIFVDRITSQLNEPDDLRFIYRVSDGDEVAVFAEKLPWDSEFFGYGVGRINGIFPLSAPYYSPYANYTDAIEALIRLSNEKGIKYLFAHVDPRDLALIRSLCKAGFVLIETRVFYHRDITNYEYKERYQVRAAKEEDIEILGSTAARMVNLYDRFHSDPFISRADADRLMYKWVEASIKENFADITIVPDHPRPTAFSTVKYHKTNWEKWKLKVAQIVLSAVAPEFKGWNRKIKSEIHHKLKDLGIERCYSTTQVTNRPMVRILEQLEYRFGKYHHVFGIVP
jgi:dTDP-4-amino-4,6-dideoxy-D-galactose acyltransferase